MTAFMNRQVATPKETKAHRAILRIFEQDHTPLSETELRSMLLTQGIIVNKTTIYRQLASLRDRGAVKEVDFGDGKKRFESNAGEHHHHLVCTKCNRIDDVRLQGELAHIEKTISKNNKFKIIDHSLEFFGLCVNCK